MDVKIETKKQAQERKHQSMPKHRNLNLDPRGINILEYAEAKAFEIKNLKNAISSSHDSQNKRIFQNLPRHMRRRAASHDVRRVPKRLRQFTNSKEYKDAKDAKAAKRKKRRKSKFLLEEYNRRKQEYKWLETHIWHSKRFYMKKCWGYNIAEKTSNKSFRATYRASKSSCLLQDISYMEVVEIWDVENAITENLIKFLPPGCTENLLDGNVVDTMMYHSTKYPLHAIGPAKLFLSNKTNNFLQLILILHPTICEELLSELCRVFDTPVIRDKASCWDKMGMEKSIEKHCLDFNIFSLTGPASTSIMRKVFGTSVECTKKVLDKKEEEERQIFNIVVQDPRFNIPNKKSNPLITDNNNKAEVHVSTLCEHSVIWDRVKRTAVSESKRTDAEVNELKEKKLVSSWDFTFDSGFNPLIPVVLVNTSIHNIRCHCVQWNVILPADWAMPFWIALVYQGARVGGQIEEMNIRLENNSLSFPLNYPDTITGAEHAQKLCNEQEEKHRRCPPDKRMNFDKLGIKYPFSQPWQELISQWNRVCAHLLQGDKPYEIMSTKGFHVVRDADVLRSLAFYMNNKINAIGSELFEMLLFLKDTLIPIQAISFGRGCPEANALICLPTTEDFEDLAKSKDGKYSTYLGPMEPAHKGLKKDFPFVFKRHDMLQHDVRCIGVNTRWTLGYVQNGRFCLADGKGRGIGFVSTSALYYMLHSSTNRNIVMFRNTKTLQYRFCEVRILI